MLERSQLPWMLPWQNALPQMHASLSQTMLCRFAPIHNRRSHKQEVLGSPLLHVLVHMSSLQMLRALCMSFCSSAAIKSSRICVHGQVLGGYGYLKEYGVERVMRDLRVHRILEGTNQIMNVIISRELSKQQR